MLAVSKSTIWRMVKSGVIKKYNIFEYCVRFNYDEVMAYAKDRMESKPIKLQKPFYKNTIND